MCSNIPITGQAYLDTIPLAKRLAIRMIESEMDQNLIRIHQRENLRKLLDTATRTTPKYRDNRWLVESVSNPYFCLNNFPYIEKEELRENYIDFCADDFDPESCFRTRTSGSTGKPLELLHDRNRLAYSSASFMRRMSAYCLVSEDRMCRIVTHEEDGIWEVTLHPLLGQLEIAFVQILDSTGYYNEEALNKIDKFHPMCIWGQPSDIRLLTTAYQELGHEPPQVNSLLTHGEDLTSVTRLTVEQMWNVVIRDIYGLQETGCIAWQCESGDYYHIDEERILIEIIDDGGNSVPDGEIGEVVVTNLVNYAMPLIKYKTSDYAAIIRDSCECGRALLGIRRLQGRTRGFIRLPNGKVFNPKPIKDYLTSEKIVSWQISQKNPTLLKLKLVMPEKCDQINRIGDYIRRLIPPNIELLILEVEEEELTRRGGKIQMYDLLETD